MNSVTQQDIKSIYRNQLYFLALTMKYQKQKAKNKIPFKMVLKKKKKKNNLGVNLAKEVENLYIENSKTM